MKIAYWSPLHGQTGTTSNLIATALITGLLFRKKCIITQTHYNFNNLEAPFVGCNTYNTASLEFFRDVGLDMLIRNFKSCKLTKKLIDNCCISLSYTNLNLLPGSLKNNRDSFEYEMNRVILNLLRTIEEFTDLILIDINSGLNPLSLKIINDSELTIVNLSQNKGVIDYYFDNIASNIQGKVFYIFGNYDRNSKYNINNIRRRYHKFISTNNSGVIPYNTSYRDAQSDGKVIEFFNDNLLSSKEDINHYFISQVKNTTEKILSCSGITQRNERIS